MTPGSVHSTEGSEATIRERDVSSPYETDEGLREIIVQFVANLGDEIPRLSEVLGRADLAELVRLAHRLKGSAKVLGFDTLGNVFGDVEELARESMGMHSQGHVPISADERAALLTQGLVRIARLHEAMRLRF
jgi:HPt (histidine-containing phosphotransfer) domain-containing protein